MTQEGAWKAAVFYGQMRDCTVSGRLLKNCITAHLRRLKSGQETPGCQDGSRNTCSNPWTQSTLLQDSIPPRIQSATPPPCHPFVPVCASLTHRRGGRCQRCRLPARAATRQQVLVPVLAVGQEAEAEGATAGSKRLCAHRHARGAAGAHSCSHGDMMSERERERG